MRKLWGGAFAEESDALVDRFGQSIADDLRFWREDVEGSIAHAQMLGECGIVTQTEADALVDGLRRILEEGPERLSRDVEDVHTAVEVRLGELIGPVAGKLHTARSRNDQVATGARLLLRRRCAEIQIATKELQGTLLAQARRRRAAVMPGYTHQQPAQPITLGFHLLAHFWALQRLGWRMERVRETAGLCPLGAAALAGTSFPIDRHRTAAALGFAAPIPNALDATSDRSFVLDALHACVCGMIDLSRLSQELVMWSGAEFGFVRLSDSVTTGSSIMPQKRNPDMAELIRGRSARAVGLYTQLAATMKALPLGYNRDTQDDKPAMFSALDLLEDSLRLTRQMLEGAEWNLARMRSAARAGLSTATDLADLLAMSGMPFRQAHERIGALARAAGGRLTESLIEEHLGAHLGPGTLAEAKRRIDPAASVRARRSLGSPGPEAMGVQLRHASRLHRRADFRLA
jgi:argininosuccinate lyase